MLEPCDAKVSRTVPRGLDDRKVVRLLGKHASPARAVLTSRKIRKTWFWA